MINATEVYYQTDIGGESRIFLNYSVNNIFSGVKLVNVLVCHSLCGHYIANCMDVEKWCEIKEIQFKVLPYGSDSVNTITYFN